MQLDKLDISEVTNVPSGLSNLKSKVDVDKLVPVLVDVSKLSNVVKNDVVQKDVDNTKIKRLIIKYQILLTQLLKLLLMQR